MAWKISRRRLAARKTGLEEGREESRESETRHVEVDREFASIRSPVELELGIHTLLYIFQGVGY